MLWQISAMIQPSQSGELAVPANPIDAVKLLGNCSGLSNTFTTTAAGLLQDTPGHFEILQSTNTRFATTLVVSIHLAVHARMKPKYQV